jgi:hypothetical protein
MQTRTLKGIFIVLIISLASNILAQDINWSSRSFGKTIKYGAKDASGKVIIPFYFDQHGTFSEGLAPVKLNSQWGFLNEKGKMVAPCQFTKASNFINGKAIVQIKRNDSLKYAYLNKEGQLISDWYDEIVPNETDVVAKVARRNPTTRKRENAYINAKGKLITPWMNFTFAFMEGITKISKREDNKWYYTLVNEEGEQLIGWYEGLAAPPTLRGPFQYFHEGLIAAQKKGKWGYIDQEDKVVIDFQFDRAENFLHMKAKVGRKRNDSKYEYQIIWKNGKALSPEYAKIWYADIKYYPEIELFITTGFNGKKGYLGPKGIIWAKPRYTIATPFWGSLAFVEENGKKKYINNSLKSPTGELEIKYGEPFVGDIAIVTNYENAKAIINEKGEVLSEWYADIKPFESEVTIVTKGSSNKQQFAYMDAKGKVLSEWFDQITGINGRNLAFDGKKWYYINSTGELTSPPFDEVWPSEDSLMKIRKDLKWGFIDHNDKLVVEYRFSHVSDWKDGLSIVSENDLQAIMNTEGKVVSGWFDKIERDALGKEFMQVKKQGKVALINIKGQLLSDWYDFMDVGPNRKYGIQSGAIAVRNGSLWGFINTAGKIVIPIEYEGFANEYGNEAIFGAKKDGKWGYINAKGEVKIKFKYDYAAPYFEGKGLVEKKDKWGYIDLDNKVVIPFQFDAASIFTDGVAPILKDGKWGYIDATGNIVITPQFSTAGSFYLGEARVNIDNVKYIINKKGECIRNCP